MKKTMQEFIQVFKEKSKSIFEGRYDEVNDLQEFSNPQTSSEEIAQLSEQVCLIAVKLEAREMDLGNKIAELKVKNQVLQDQIKAREEFGLIFILFTLFIGLYSFVVSFMNLSNTFTAEQLITARPLANLFYCIILIILAIVMIKHAGLPISKFGVTLNKTKQALTEAFIATAIVLIAMTLLKIWAVYNLESFKGQPIITLSTINWTFWAYFLVAPIQEFITRGVLQGSMARLLCNRYANFWAIIMASILFGVTHTHYSFWLSIASVFSGLLWGYLYTRTENIIGISISHFLLGNYLLLLDFWKYMH